MPRPVLVTGGAGYIGGQTCLNLSRLGFYPVVIDDLSTGHRALLRELTGCAFVRGDIADRKLLLDIFEAYAIECVFHFAASCYVGESISRPRKYFHNNVTKTLTLLDTMCDAGVKHIVFSSSCATYGIPVQLPMSEAAPQLPINPYGESKLFVERALKWYGNAYGLKWISLRYFNAAGADPEGRLGEDHDPETHLIPLAIDAVLGNAPELNIYGSDHGTADGSAVRDYIHVSDLASAHVLASEYLWAGGQSDAFNLGTGVGHSVFEVIQAVEAALGRKVPSRLTEKRAGDPPILVADAQRAHQVLQWSPRHSTLREIVESACRWHKCKPSLDLKDGNQ